MSSAARLRVRPTEARDLDRVCAIVNHFIETTAFNFRIESQQVEEWLHNWERLHRLYPWLVAIEGQRVIGFAYAAPWKARDAYRWTVESTVYVDHECHRRGVGDALYAELLARLERQGFRTSIGVIALPNPASVRLHERHGFVQVGLLADAGYKLKRWHDVGFWQRRLSGGEQAPPTLTPVDDDGSGV